MKCNGQLLSISQNEVLFNLIGTTYGGDGQVTFALPDLRGRFPLHVGPSHVLAQASGSATTTLTTQHLPVHTHYVTPTLLNPFGVQTASYVGSPRQDGPLLSVDGSSASRATAPAGQSSPIDNYPPYLAVNYIISLFGIFPSET